MNIDQFICLIFTHIGLLSAGILMCERNFLFSIENCLSKFSKKHNVCIDRTTYCRFEGMQTIKSATSLLVLDTMMFLFKVKDLKIIMTIICIWAIGVIVFYNINKKKLINMLQSKEIQY